MKCSFIFFLNTHIYVFFVADMISVSHNWFIDICDFVELERFLIISVESNSNSYKINTGKGPA